MPRLPARGSRRADVGTAVPRSDQSADEIEAASRDGAYIVGLSIEGALPVCCRVMFLLGGETAVLKSPDPLIPLLDAFL